MSLYCKQSSKEIMAEAMDIHACNATTIDVTHCLHNRV